MSKELDKETKDLISQALREWYPDMIDNLCYLWDLHTKMTTEFIKRLMKK